MELLPYLPLAKKMWTREDLINLCEQAIIPQQKWKNYNTYSDVQQTGELWALLKAGCRFTVKGQSEIRVFVDVLITGDDIQDEHGNKIGTEMYEYSYRLPNPDIINGEDWAYLYD